MSQVLASTELRVLPLDGCELADTFGLAPGLGGRLLDGGELCAVDHAVLLHFLVIFGLIFFCIFVGRGSVVQNNHLVLKRVLRGRLLALPFEGVQMVELFEIEAFEFIGVWKFLNAFPIGC